jgi:colanic acid biosynthesis glycosyl transferase WcaI
MKFLLLNQAFYPDLVSTSQHAQDLAKSLVAAGHEVTVVSSRRGYDDPSLRYCSLEVWQGVRILRIGCSGLGKSARWRRAVDFGSFFANCFLQLSVLPAFDVVLTMTSPPLISTLAAMFSQWKGGRLILWVMDLNPDEAVAAKWLGERSAVTRILEACLRYSLRRAEKIVVLDRFMKERIVCKGVAERKVEVIPPWSHDTSVCYDVDGRRTFRERHGLSNKYVVMYSGNHSPCHPLDTLLEAASRLADHRHVKFCFVGGGSEFSKVRAFAQDRNLPNIVCLPYQSLTDLSASLSAGDMHVVVMGDPFVGIVHPCKIYNILALGIPFVYIGPEKSHLVDILRLTAEEEAAETLHTRSSFRHGDVDGLARCILASAAAGGRQSKAELQVATKFSGKELPRQFVQLITVQDIGRRSRTESGIGDPTNSEISTPAGGGFGV